MEGMAPSGRSMAIIVMPWANPRSRDRVAGDAWHRRHPPPLRENGIENKPRRAGGFENSLEFVVRAGMFQSHL